MEEPGGLPSMGSHRVGHDWSDLVVVVVVVVDVNQPQVYMCPPSLTLLPPPYPSHSSGLSQCTGSECPVSCIELGLVIYFTYGNNTCFNAVSQIPPLPSPTLQKSVHMNQPWVYMCSPSWTPLPPPSPSHSSGSSQCTSPEHPVSCIEPGLVICFTYDNIHVLMLFSQIIPPSPSPTESKRLFYISVSPLLSRI